MDSLDVLNITSSHLKQIGVDAFNKTTQGNASPPLSQLDFKRTGDNSKVLLQDPVTKSGIVMSKIDISTIFPKTVSIQEFKTEQICTALPVYKGYAARMNARYSVAVVSEEIVLINANTNLSIDLIKNFVTFCRVYGFFELKLNDVNLIDDSGKLIIIVNESNPLFTGRLEVLV